MRQATAQLFGDIQVVGLDVFLEDFRAGVPGDLHNVVDVDAGEVHKRRSGSSRSVAVDQFPFGNALQGGFAAFRGFDDHFIVSPGFSGSVTSSIQRLVEV